MNELFGNEAVYIPVDEDGFLNNIASFSYLSTSDKVHLDSIVKGIKETLSSIPITVYLRGSLAYGRFVEGVSDVDIVVITKKKDINHVKELEKLAGHFSTQFSCWCQLVDISICTLVELEMPSRNRLYMNLALTGLVLYSDEKPPVFSRLAPNHELSLRIQNQTIQDCLDTLQIIQKQKCVSFMGKQRGADFLCVWYMRDLLRGLIAFVMDDNQTFSLQPTACCEAFINRYPEFTSFVIQLWKAERLPFKDWQALSQIAEQGLEMYLHLSNIKHMA